MKMTRPPRPPLVLPDPPMRKRHHFCNNFHGDGDEAERCDMCQGLWAEFNYANEGNLKELVQDKWPDVKIVK